MSNRKDRTQALAARSRFRMDDLQVQPDRLVVIRDGAEIRLELRMMEVLVFLAEHSGEAMSTDRLLIEIWEGAFYGDNPVNKTISTLRSRIGDDSRTPRYIETVSKVGYRLIASVTLPEDYRRMPTNSDRWTAGSPYVGLSAFDNSHTKVFCGRGGVVTELLQAMRNQIDNRRRFVLMVGSSGCGKTSLLRAGVIPRLSRSNGMDGLEALSIASCDLAATQAGDMLSPLAAALAAWTLDGRAVMPPQTPEQLRTLLAETPEAIHGYVDEAFRRCAGDRYEQQPHAHLLLTIDHAEALVAGGSADAVSLDAFARALQAICACPRVLTVMLARLDFYPKLSEALPALVELKTGGGHIEVFTPRYGEIGDIIRKPAWQADLSFEKHPETNMRLDDVLRDATRFQPDALPLLQHTLQTLYERRTTQGVLTFAAYDALGGLEGAIAHRAEEVFTSLSPEAQRSLDEVFTKIVNLKSENDPVSARRPNLADFGPSTRPLVDAFIEARLFVSGLHQGHPIVGVAHEALLRQWPRAAGWAEGNRRLLQAKARLQRAAARWLEEGRNADHLLNPGTPLGEAQEVCSAMPDQISETEKAFLLESEKTKKARSKIKRMGVTILAMLTIGLAALTAALLVALDETTESQKKAQQFADVVFEVANDLQKTGDMAVLSNISMKTLSALERSTRKKKTVLDHINESRALDLAGNVFLAKGNQKQASESFQSALDSARNAKSSDPDMNGALVQYGQAAFWMGNYYFNQRNFDKAEEYWKEYNRQYVELHQRNPENIDYTMELSFSFDNLGTIYENKGNDRRAFSSYEKSLSLKVECIEIQPGNQDWIFESIVTRSKIGNIQLLSGDLTGAQRTYEILIGELAPLVEGNKLALEWKRQLASLYQIKSRLSVMQGNIDLAKIEIEKSIYYFDEIISAAPDRADWKKMLAKAHFDAADIDRILNDADIESHLEKTIKIIDSLSMNGDTPIPLRHTRAGVNVIKALASKHGKDLNLLTRGIDELELLQRSQPKDHYILSLLAFSLISRGKHELHRKNTRGYLSDLRKARSILSETAQESRDPRLIAPRHFIDKALGQVSEKDPDGIWLSSIGYLNPDYISDTQKQKGPR